MPKKDLDITGQKFNHLTALYRDESNHRYRWFQCDCGNIKRIRKGSVMRKEGGKQRVTKGCGCLIHQTGSVRGNRRHGMRHSQFYKARDSMQQRLHSKTNEKYKRIWQSKGIKCLWKDFLEFKDDMYESYLNHVKKYGEHNTTLDRIDPDGDYCKDNCRWATYVMQNNHLKGKRYVDPDRAIKKAEIELL